MHLIPTTIVHKRSHIIMNHDEFICSRCDSPKIRLIRVGGRLRQYVPGGPNGGGYFIGDQGISSPAPKRVNIQFSRVSGISPVVSIEEKLPNLAIVGDQSSGMSSKLVAITGTPFLRSSQHMPMEKHQGHNNSRNPPRKNLKPRSLSIQHR
jgi:hypothetical protein